MEFLIDHVKDGFYIDVIHGPLQEEPHLDSPSSFDGQHTTLGPFASLEAAQAEVAKIKKDNPNWESL